MSRAVKYKIETDEQAKESRRKKNSGIHLSSKEIASRTEAISYDEVQRAAIWDIFFCPICKSRYDQIKTEYVNINPPRHDFVEIAEEHLSERHEYYNRVETERMNKNVKYGIPVDCSPEEEMYVQVWHELKTNRAKDPKRVLSIKERLGIWF